MQIPGSNEKPSALIMDNEHPKRSVHGGIIIIMCLPLDFTSFFLQHGFNLEIGTSILSRVD